jgi:hypothetical protein
MPNYFRGINVTNKLNKFIRMYILRTSEFYEKPDALNGILITNLFVIYLLSGYRMRFVNYCQSIHTDKIPYESFDYYSCLK